MNITFIPIVEAKNYLTRVLDSLSPINALDIEDGNTSWSLMETVEEFITRMNELLESDNQGYTTQELYEEFITPKLQRIIQLFTAASDFIYDMSNYLECIEVDRFEGRFNLKYFLFENL